jgi:hypothetical protein
MIVSTGGAGGGWQLLGPTGFWGGGGGGGGKTRPCPRPVAMPKGVFIIKKKRESQKKEFKK